MAIFDRTVPPIANCFVSRTTTSRPVTATVTTAPVQSTANSRDDEAGRFASSPWEGLYWEADPPTEARRDEFGTLGRFLTNLMYGE
jgi:hypothetical protein